MERRLFPVFIAYSPGRRHSVIDPTFLSLFLPLPSHRLFSKIDAVSRRPPAPRLETLAAPLLFESQGIGANATFAERTAAFERLPQGLRKERLFAAGQTIPWFARSAKSSQPIRGILREFAVLFHNCLISYYMSQIFSRTSDQIPHQPLLSFGGLIERNVPSRRQPA